MGKLPTRFAVFILFLGLSITGNSQGSDSLQIKNIAGSISLKTRTSFRLLTATHAQDLFASRLNDSLKRFKNVLLETGHNILNEPIKLNTAVINYESIADSSYLSYGESYFFNNLYMSSDWSVAGIPVVIGLQKQSWSDYNSNDAFRFSFEFDRENYLSQLKKKLIGKFDPSGLLKSVKNPIETILAEARKSLTNELEGLSNNYKGLLNNEVQQIKNIQNLFTTDIKSLKEKFLNQSFIKEVAQKENLLAALQQKMNNGEKINEDEFSDLQNAVIKMKGIQDLLKKIEQHKTRWEQSGLLKKIREFDLLNKANISRLLNDPSTITKLARQKLSLSSLQRLFLNVTHLNIGQNVLSLSPLSLQHFLSNGVSTGFISNNLALTFVAGKQSDFNSILDYSFTSSPFSNNGIVKAIRIQSGTGTKSTTNLSVSSFSQSMSGLINQVNPSVLRQILVTTISNQFSIGERGMVNVELSRSATQYNQTGSNADSALQEKNNLSRIFSAENFMANTAISLKYADEYTEQGLAYNVGFSKTANGYTNPGNSYLSTGTTEFGMGVRKSFLKNKILLSFRGNARVYKYNDKLDASWRNSNMMLDAKWKMKKGQYIAIRYQPVKMSRMESRHKTPVSSVERVSAEANIYKKFGKIMYRNFFSLSGQKNRYTIERNTAIKNNSLTVSSFQHILIGKRMLYVNINYTHANNSTQYVFLNSSFYTEAGYTYQLHKNITASSGFVYNNTDSWYRQAGIRQTVSGQLGEKFSVNVYVDLKKNLMVIQPLWNEPVRADISLRYILKSKN